MALASGTRFGPYEVTALLGTGGMGEVYRARDTQLNRDVAIKVVAPARVDDADRAARIGREAQLLATLNHPNIAHIHGIEETDGGRAIVMELVAGETLAERIAGGALPLDEALPIAKQIAEALEAAHEQGIIHRDLKPANVKIRPDGLVKVLDFGLAKAFSRADAHRGATPAADSTATAALTLEGMLLGTAAYMSPEQAKGREADPRSDIWAFGCVLFEMLTGARPFKGTDLADTIVAVLSKEPDWQKLPAAAASVRPLLARCLKKDARQRLQAIGDARIQIEELMTAPSNATEIPAAADGAVRPGFGLAVAATLIAAAAVGALMTWALSRPAGPPAVPTGRFEIVPPPTAALAIQGADRDFAVAPDGSFVAYRAGVQAQLVVRRLDRLDTSALAGVTNARAPFVSPDGRWIGFVENNTTLKKVAVSGGAPISLAVLPGSQRGASWIDDTTLIVATNATGLLRVPASGGEPTVLTTPDPSQGELAHLHPSPLPGGRAVLFTIAAARPEGAQIAVLDLQTGRTSRLIRGGTDARYLSSGHLLYAAGDTLSAVKFDRTGLAVVGAPAPVIEGVAVSDTGALNAAVTEAGTLLYLRSGAGSTPRSLSWVDRQGRETPIPAPLRSYASLRLSPDGTRLAVEVREPTPNIWVWDLTRETLTPLTFSGGLAPVWTPDGQRILFAAAGSQSPNLHALAADGTGKVTRLTTTNNVQVPTSVTPGGTSVVTVERRARTASDLVRVALDGSADGAKAAEGLIETPFTEQNGEVSPDGRFLAYESNESGRFEIYVQPYPNLNGKWRVSTDGGTRPVWTRNGHELVYLDPTNHLTIVPVETGGLALRAGTTRPLSITAYTATNIAWRTYDVSPDGERFVIIKESPAAGDERFVVVLNFFDELKAKLAAR